MAEIHNFAKSEKMQIRLDRAKAKIWQPCNIHHRGRAKSAPIMLNRMTPKEPVLILRVSA